MTIKVFQSLTTPVGTNEQVGVGQYTATASGSFRERGIAAGAAKGLFLMNVSAISGTGASLTVAINGRDPGSRNWVQICTFPAQTAVSTAPLTQAVDPLYFQEIQCSYTVAGTTPSITFSCGVILLSEE